MDDMGGWEGGGCLFRCLCKCVYVCVCVRTSVCYKKKFAYYICSLSDSLSFRYLLSFCQWVVYGIQNIFHIHRIDVSYLRLRRLNGTTHQFGGIAFIKWSINISITISRVLIYARKIHACIQWMAETILQCGSIADSKQQVFCYMATCSKSEDWELLFFIVDMLFSSFHF